MFQKNSVDKVVQAFTTTMKQLAEIKSAREAEVASLNKKLESTSLERDRASSILTKLEAIFN